MNQSFILSVIIQNSNFSINTLTRSIIFIESYYNVFLTVNNTLFYSHNAIDTGGIFYGDQFGAKIYVYNSNFTQNAALEGGVF